MDEALIINAQKGDKESFTAAVLQINDQAYKIAYCYLHNEEDSMDAVCEAVEKALRNIKKLREPSFFKTWFIRIVINECKMQLRIKGKAINIEDALQEDAYPMDRVAGEERIDLQKQLKQLAPIERNMIYMKYYLGYTLDEISEILKMPVGTVKTKIYNCLKKMREKLEIKGGY